MIMLFSLDAAFSASLLGLFLWWLLITRPGQLTVGRGVLVGILGSLAAHPLTWLLFTVITLPSGRLAISNPTPDTIAGFLGEISLLSSYSLYLVGWLTTLIGGLVGAVLAKTVAGRRQEHGYS